MAIAIPTRGDAAAHGAYTAMMQTTIDDEEFALWVELLNRRIGLRDTVIRKSTLIQSVETRLRKRGGTLSRRAYFDLLRAAKSNDQEWDHLIELLPLHETRFLRHQSSLDVLRDYVAERCADSGQRPNSLSVWSVGCSTGEEVYSLAIVMNEAAGAFDPRPRINVTGSDMSRNSLNVGRRGSYHRRQLTNVSAVQMATWFDKDDNETYTVKPALREQTQFVALNLCAADADDNVVGPVDIVFCQNVLIYFDMPERERIVNQLAEHVLPGGILVLGAGELLRWTRADFKRIAGDETFAFKKQSLLI